MTTFSTETSLRTSPLDGITEIGAAADEGRELLYALEDMAVETAQIAENIAEGLEPAEKGKAIERLASRSLRLLSIARREYAGIKSQSDAIEAHIQQRYQDDLGTIAEELRTNENFERLRREYTASENAAACEKPDTLTWTNAIQAQGVAFKALLAAKVTRPAQTMIKLEIARHLFDDEHDIASAIMTDLRSMTV